MDIDDVTRLVAEKLSKKQIISMLFNQINKNEKKIAIYFNEKNTIVYEDLIKSRFFEKYKEKPSNFNS